MTDDAGQPLTIWGVLSLCALVTRDELGHCCGQHGCHELARWLVPWPGREPAPQCQRHYEWTLHVAGTFQMADMIRLGTRPLEVKRRYAEPEDQTAARFAAMELE